MKERLRNLVKPRLQNPTHPNGIQGSIDRAHNGIVSGWLHCTRCNSSTLPTLEIESSAPRELIERRLTERLDVPGGRGFLFRFSPTLQGKAHSRSVDVYCPQHPATRITKNIDETEWATPALAAIQYSCWPTITGWVLVLDPKNATSPPLLKIGDRESIPLLDNSVSEPVAEQLGHLGLTSFTTDLSRGTGLAAHNGTSIALWFQNLLLEETTVRGSYPTSTTAACRRERTNLIRIPHAGKRTELEVEALSAEQFDRYISLDYSLTENLQWREFLRRHGVPERPASAWIALRRQTLNPIAVTSFLPECVNEMLESRPTEKVDIGYPATATYLELINELTNSSLTLNSGGLTSLPKEQNAGPQTDSPLKVCIVGLVNHKSGLGQNAANSIAALHLAGIHVCDSSLFPFPGGWNPDLVVQSGSVCDLSDHTVILHLPIDRIPETLAMQPALATAKKLIGYFMWETEVIPIDLYRGLDLVDEIWTATEFVGNALRASTSTPVFETGHAVNLVIDDTDDIKRSHFGIAEDAFVVHFSFDANSTVARKNPNAALRAFSAAFGSDPNCLFILKVRNFQQVEWLAQRGCRHSTDLLQLVATMPNIRLITSEMSHSKTLALVALSDCYLSLHRSEGFGYTIAEALKLGIPTIATGYSGCASFTNFSNFHSVDYSLIEIAPGEYFYSEAGMVWAQADIAMAGDLLTHVRSNSPTPTSRNRPHRETPDNAYSIEALSSRYIEILSELPQTSSPDEARP